MAQPTPFRPMGPSEVRRSEPPRLRLVRSRRQSEQEYPQVDLRALVGVALGGQEPPEHLPLMSHDQIDRWAYPYLG